MSTISLAFHKIFDEGLMSLEKLKTAHEKWHLGLETSQGGGTQIIGIQQKIHPSKRLYSDLTPITGYWDHFCLENRCFQSLLFHADMVVWGSIRARKRLRPLQFPQFRSMNET